MARLGVGDVTGAYLVVLDARESHLFVFCNSELPLRTAQGVLAGVFCLCHGWRGVLLFLFEIILRGPGCLIAGLNVAVGLAAGHGTGCVQCALTA